MTTRRLSPEHRDVGATVVELPLAVGLLLLPIAMIVMALPSWPERQTIATAAAKEAASLYAAATGPAAGAALARDAVNTAAANFGLPAGSLQLQLSGEWCRACTVTARVTVEIPSLVIPFVGDTGTFAWSAKSNARVDDYRSISP